MTERVRAVLITPDGCLLAVRRDRPDHATYWVLPRHRPEAGRNRRTAPRRHRLGT